MKRLQFEKEGDIITDLLVKLFIKNPDDVDKSDVRTAYGLMSGVVGIILNALLFTAKLLVGIFIGSVSVMADAFNNLSDAASSVIGFVGVKLASRPADKEHPFGHGRYEYIASLIVAFLVLQVAFTCFKSAVEKITSPSELDFSIISIIILLASVLVKFWIGLFNRKLGKRINSTVMKATATDSISDMVVTLATVVSIFIDHFFELRIDGYVGCVVSLFVFMAGINIARETIEPILGAPVKKEIYDKLTGIVLSYPGIIGVHDLIIHNYGPSHMMATIHAEVRNDVNIEEAHETIDRIERDVLREMNLFLVIHMDPIEVDNASINEKRKILLEIVTSLVPEASIHDVRMVNGENRINLIFDMVLPYTYKREDEKALVENISRLVKEKDERYECVITIDRSYMG